MANWRLIEKQYIDDPINFPITRASLNLTQNCNFKCPWCFTWGRTQQSMTFETARKIVDFLFKNAQKIQDTVEVAYWGGEPLLEWDLLKEITLYAVKKSLQMKVPVQFSGTTNGSLLTPDKFDFLDRYRIFFLFSFDGTKESHDRFRVLGTGKGSFDICFANLKAALRKWPFYRTRLSLSADNVHRFFEDMKFMIDLGITHLIFSPVYETDWTDEKWEIFYEQSCRLIDYIAHLRDQGKVITIEHFKSYVQKDMSNYPCGAGRFYVGFDYDGSMYPCHRFNKFSDNRPWYEKEECIGHIDADPVITNPQFRLPFLQFNPQCDRECDAWKNTPCHGGCYAVNWDFNKDITKPYSGLCKYALTQRRISLYWANRIKEPENYGQNCQCFNTTYNRTTTFSQPTPSQVWQVGSDQFWLEMFSLLQSINNKLDRLK